ncbi:MAG TPA: hypothetical protein VFM75_01705 [Modicisalibacter sp.]|nr:hypothetical protein [Modicisalibacter sp.]
MLNWVSQHQAVLSVLINLGTLAVWLIYAQLLYFGFRRQRRPRVIINRGRKKDVDALCIISNMSAEAIFIEYIIAELKTSRGTIVMDVTDHDQSNSQGNNAGDDAKEQLGSVGEYTRQGPLASSDFMHIGTFSDVIQRLAKEAGIEMQGYRPKGELRFRSLTIRLIAIYGPEDKPIGSERCFNLNLEEDESKYTLVPDSWDTRRLASSRQRRRLRKNVDDMNEGNYSSSSTIRLQ